jgi:hypothetical protein
LEHDEQAVLETGQVIDVDAEPHQPRRKAAELDVADLSDCPAPADGGHLSLVHEVERFARRAFSITKDRPAHRTPLLHGDGRGTRQRGACLMCKEREVACDKDIRMGFHAEVWLDDNPPLPIDLRPE